MNETQLKMVLPTAYISIGANINPRLHIQNALQSLQCDFKNTSISSVYESKAVGFEGDNFLNLVIAVDSHLSINDLNCYLNDLENREGRERLNGKAWDSRTLDLDILLFGEEVGVIDNVELPRGEILEHAHVLKPLAEIAGNLVHSPTSKSYAQLGQEIVFENQEIWRVEL